MTNTREAAQRVLNAATQAFVELDNWLEDRADADHPTGALGPQPNDEMRMLGELELIRKGFTALEAENASLKQDVIAFAGAWGGYYAELHQLPANHLHSTHYDILERCGARMVDFVRHEAEHD